MIVLKSMFLVVNKLFREIDDQCVLISRKNMSQKILFGLLSICYLTVKITFAANILYLCALPSPSHQVWYIKYFFICF